MAKQGSKYRVFALIWDFSVRHGRTCLGLLHTLLKAEGITVNRGEGIKSQRVGK